MVPARHRPQKHDASSGYRASCEVGKLTLYRLTRDTQYLSQSLIPSTAATNQGTCTGVFNDIHEATGVAACGFSMVFSSVHSKNPDFSYSFHSIIGLKSLLRLIKTCPSALLQFTCVLYTIATVGLITHYHYSSML